MTVLDYIMEYAENKDIMFYNDDEAKRFESGVSQYLLENGINKDDEREYFKKFVCRHLKMIDTEDIKAYFDSYNIISKINQIVIESRGTKKIPIARKDELLMCLSSLHEIGLGEKYIPIIEIKKILGENY